MYYRQMHSRHAALILAAIIVVVIILARVFRGSEQFYPGPQNIGLYDHPYGYPRYQARRAKWWDRRHRCAAYCGSGDCVIWCR